jgi:hypothetical protein
VRRLAAWAFVASTWVAAGAGSLAVARYTKLGPSMSLSYRHGVHAGDVAAVAVGALLAGACTWAARHRLWSGRTT